MVEKYAFDNNNDYLVEVKDKKQPYDVMTKEELEAFWAENNAHTPTANKGTGKMREINKMEQSIKEAAQQYEPKKTKNISDLPEIQIENMKVEDKEGGTEPNKFTYKAIVVNGEEYRVPGIVLGDIKAILEKKPDLKRISVSRTGTDKNNTRYTVIPIE